eukprot:GDKI01014532.1.p1 GENE.GDKI01014532.1~~GDKI01014532.1.p1  ORF type:complete len:131 (-),score=39.51 GDKI01014532.1:243-635(-)
MCVNFYTHVSIFTYICQFLHTFVNFNTHVRATCGCVLHTCVCAAHASHTCVRVLHQSVVMQQNDVCKCVSVCCFPRGLVCMYVCECVCLCVLQHNANTGIRRVQVCVCVVEFVCMCVWLYVYVHCAYRVC